MARGYGTGAKDAGESERLLGDDEGGYSDKSSGLTNLEAAELIKKYGKNELPEKHVPLWYVFISLLWQPMPVMIWIAAAIEAFIANYVDMSILLFIQFANASIAFYETTKAADAVAALKASLKPEATAKRDGKWIKIDASMLVPGDLVLLGSGSAIPADCVVNEGSIDVDQAQLTGESLPVSMFENSVCMMGSTVVRGETEATVQYTGSDTFFGKTASLLQGDSELSNLQNILIDIMIVLVFLSSVLCTVVFIYLLGSSESVIDSLSFVVVLMVASIPLAIEIVTTTTLALGSKELSKHGAIVTRLSAIEDMAGMAILCSDKTGTLTLNTMIIQDYTPVYYPGETQKTLLQNAAMAAKWNEPPRDALDRLVLGAADIGALDQYQQTEYMPFDPITKRTGGSLINKKTQEKFKVTKGAPHVLQELILSSWHLEGQSHDTSTSKSPFAVPVSPEAAAILATNKAIELDIKSLGLKGIRCLAVARSEMFGAEERWRMLGLLTFLDPPRPDTKKTIADARKYGVEVKMITGDHLLIAEEMARLLDLGNRIYTAEGVPMLDLVTKQKPKDLVEKCGDLCMAADGFAQVYPEHKYLIVECLREMGYKVGMTGDGVNDAPALKRADVGIAVHGATDAARAAASIVLTEPGLSTIIDGIIVARCIFLRIRNFIAYRIAATLQLLFFFFIAVFAFKPSDYQPEENPDDTDWPSFFHMPVLMLMLITLLNDGTLIAIAYDDVVPRDTPEVWNLRVLFTVGFVIGGVACISSLLLLFMLLTSWDEGGFFATLGLPGLSYGQITTAIYLKVSISDFLTLFSCRTGDDWFWSSRPAPVLFVAAMVALSTSTILACAWPASYPDDIYTIGLGRRQPYTLALYIWIYCLFWWILQDISKIYIYKFLTAFNVFGINDTGSVIYQPSTLDFIQRKQREKEKASQAGFVHPATQF